MALAASVLATAVSGLFAVRLLRRFVTGSPAGTALLHWGVALASFCLASASLLVGELVGWSPTTFRGFYLFGAVLNVPWLALGSVHISADSRAVSRALGVVALGIGAAFLPAALAGEALAVPGAALGLAWGSLLLVTSGDRLRAASLVLLVVFAVTATAVVLGAGLEAPIPDDRLPEGRELLSARVRGFAVGGNAVGAMLVIVGAAASSVALAWSSADAATRTAFRRQLRRAPLEALAVLTLRSARATRARGLGHLAVGNLLIALGVLVAASGGAFSFLGATVGHAIALAIGVTVMFRGFVRTGRRYGPAAAAPPEAGHGTR